MARLSFRCDDELLRLVDERRGEIPRERFLRGVVKRAVGLPGSESWKASEQALGSSGRAGVRGRVPALPPAEQPHGSGQPPDKDFSHLGDVPVLRARALADAQPGCTRSVA